METDYSVLMSVYQKEEPSFFHDAIQSILRQTIRPKQIVLVCDGPLTDGLEQELEALQENQRDILRLVRLPACGGLGSALQKGLQSCSCELVARMDTDDLAVPNRMELQLAELDRDPSLSVLGGQITEFWISPDRISGSRRVPCDNEAIRTFAASRNPMNHMTVMFRKNAVLAAGSYRSFDRFEDYDLWSRMLAGGARFRNLDQVLVYARVAPDSYRRRGGMDYFRQSVRMQKQLRACGLLGPAAYCRNLAVRFAGTVLLPNRLRGLVYQKHLHKKLPSEES